jgi:serine/threonine protein kinase
LKRIEFKAFLGCHVSILIPSSILFLAHNFFPILDRVSFPGSNSCPMFDRWRYLRESGITVDFQRILRSDASFRYFKDAVVDFSGFEEESIIGQRDRRDRCLTQLHRRLIDGVFTVVKTLSIPHSIEICQLETEMENQMNLRHPMIAPLIGCGIPQESSGFWELKTVRLYASSDSLAGVLLNPPDWWTPTAKAKAILGIALGLRFVHGHGFLHGAVKATNILFDANHRIQIADFSLIRLENGSVEPFSGEGWSPAVDVSAFASLLSEIVIGNSANSPICSINDSSLRPAVPAFVRQIIERAQSTKSQCLLSFIDIVDILNENHFQITPGVDSEEVFKFVSWVESSEQSGAWK